MPVLRTGMSDKRLLSLAGAFLLDMNMAEPI